jgi:hypothetical protein
MLASFAPSWWLKLLAATVAAACMLVAHAQTDVDVSDQANPSAVALARNLIYKDMWELITKGKHAPKFAGPPGSAKILPSYRAPGWTYEKDVLNLPTGAVKLQTPPGAKGAVVELKFSAISKARLTCLPSLPSRYTACLPSYDCDFVRLMRCRIAALVNSVLIMGQLK